MFITVCPKCIDIFSIPNHLKCYSVPKVELSNNVQFFLGNEAEVLR